MKCPRCGEDLVPSKKNPEYMLCYQCRKKFKVAPKESSEEEKVQPEEQTYSNIPPKKVREKSEKEMRKAYDDMLSTESTKSGKKRAKQEEDTEDDYYEYDEEDKVSKAPVIILGIAIVIIAAVIVYMMFFR